MCDNSKRDYKSNIIHADDYKKNMPEISYDHNLHNNNYNIMQKI